MPYNKLNTAFISFEKKDNFTSQINEHQDQITNVESEKNYFSEGKLTTYFYIFTFEIWIQFTIKKIHTKPVHVSIICDGETSQHPVQYITRAISMSL
jgi:hypothetical protein